MNTERVFIQVIKNIIKESSNESGTTKNNQETEKKLEKAKTIAEVKRSKQRKLTEEPDVSALINLNTEYIFKIVIAGLPKEPAPSDQNSTSDQHSRKSPEKASAENSPEKVDENPSNKIPENSSKIDELQGLIKANTELVLNDAINTIFYENPTKDSPPDMVLRYHFHYHFDENSKLRHTETGSSFKFVNQKHYEELSKWVERYIQQQMKEKYGLIKESIPVDAKYEHSPKSYIYISPNFTSESQHFDKALLLIQGAGAVRPGFWARSVVINDSMFTGSMLPFLDFAKNSGFEVIIFNPNKNSSKGKKIPLNDSLASHGKYLWERYIRRCNAHDLYIVAHSCGGVSTAGLMKNFWEEFSDRVKGIAYTDAVMHGYHGMGSAQEKFLKRRAVDWVASMAPLDKIIRTEEAGMVCVSSGHSKHEYTTGSAFHSIIKFFEVINEKNPFLSEGHSKTKCNIHG